MAEGAGVWVTASRLLLPCDRWHLLVTVTPLGLCLDLTPPSMELASEAAPGCGVPDSTVALEGQ